MEKSKLISFGDIREANGKTIRENNLEKKHKIPIGTLVEIEYTEWQGKGCCLKTKRRLYVWEHIWDCDGTPLYLLSPTTLNRKEMYSDFSELGIKINNVFKEILVKSFFGIIGNFAEESLTPIEMNNDIYEGKIMPEWYSNS